jgi:hypothetical protein
VVAASAGPVAGRSLVRVLGDEEVQERHPGVAQP